MVSNHSNIKKVAIVTTSWDDGYPLDISLAKMLAAYNLRGTFYVPLEGVPIEEAITIHKGEMDKLPVLDRNMIRTINMMGMEIGSHASTHTVLTKERAEIVMSELTKSKKVLEDIIDEPVVSFCYPKGKFNSAVRAQVIKAGYKLARTTIPFRMDDCFDLFYMPVSFQFFPHTGIFYIRKFFQESNYRGLVDWCRFLRMENDPLKLSELILEYILDHGGILHIWGHSWEIEQFALWGTLEKVFRGIANRQGVLYLTNAQVLEVIGK